VFKLYTKFERNEIIRGPVIDENSGSIIEASPTGEPPEYIWYPSSVQLLSVVYW